MKIENFSNISVFSFLKKRPNIYLIILFFVSIFGITLVVQNLSLKRILEDLKSKLYLNESTCSAIKNDLNQFRENEKVLIASASAEYAGNKYIALNELKFELKNIINGDFELLKADNFGHSVDYYSKEINLSYMKKEYKRNNASKANRQIVISAYKYVPGTIVESGYEGVSWEVNMDEWVNYLKIINPTTKKVKMVSWWRMDKEESPILVKRWFNHTFGIYDTSFKPAGTFSRYFITFDQSHNNIIEIEARDYNINVDWQQNSAIYKYSNDVEDFYSSVEDAIANVVSQD